MTTTPAGELRAAAQLLREAAGHATPGPWRTHDTHLGSVGGHTATVLTDRENLNDTELIAWLPTMSNEPWDETRNAWRNAGWMALVHPGVGLAVADWLELAGRFAALHADLFTASTGRAPTEADLDAATRAALTVARRVLGETTTDTAAPWPPSSPERPDHDLYTCLRKAGHTPEQAQRMIGAYTETVTRHAPAAVPLAEVWTVWHEDESVWAHFATEDAAKQGTIDCWEEDEPSCPDYSWRQDGPRLELVVGGEHGGVYASRHRVYGVPAPADRAAILREAADAADTVAAGLRGDSAVGAYAVLQDLYRMVDETQQPTGAENDALTDCATEYRVPVPENGGEQLLVRRQSGAQGVGWAVSVMARGGGRAWTTEGWQESISALSVDRLFCWPDARTAVDEARRALTAPAVTEEPTP